MRFKGVLFLPVTPFSASGSVDTAKLHEHVESRLSYQPGGVFPACGTGEFHALDIEEIRAVVTTGVSAVNGQVPVIAGAGAAGRELVDA